jgi:DNA-binding NarL/FixJ family response regulator
MSIYIAIADDHTFIAEGISKMLARYPHIEVGEHYMTGAALLKGLETGQPDVLLLDIQFPDTTGNALVRILSPRYPNMKILVITSIVDPFEVQDMLQHGCLGYVQKNVSSAVLAHAIETVHRNERFMEASVQQRLWETMLAPKVESPFQISAKEQEILELICEGLSNMEIGDKLFMSHRTVENYKMSLYQKFGVHNAVTLTKMALRYKFIK